MDEHRGHPFDRSGLEPHEREALERLDRLRPPPPSAEARSRTRNVFVEGEADGAGETPRRAPGAPPPRRHAWIAAAAGVAAVVALLVYGYLPDDSWSVGGVKGPPEAEREAETFEVVEGRALEAGSFHVQEETELEIHLDDLILRTLGETRFELPPPPGRWLGRARTLELTEGEIYGSSGEQPLDFELELRTPEATARLVGTTFAVFRTEEATCFCLYRGGLEIHAIGRDETIELPVGKRIFVYKDGREPSIEPLDQGETMKLRMIDDVAREPAPSPPEDGGGS